ncbi:MAG: TetR/AcrR family transcriptional regulator [Sphingomonas sp.]|uniref:TetR/AcrR family transcriptional regulator n=1 Tax=Sphingomonas sp. TaxID=28214 RepID=UPI0025E4E837|nr:TetR/AcrR family transcriptional regulator [Sphingomonas sp.]MBX9882703.1 TetR/AcrR family transcriptional regulator [Sphingomonas sp.]
MRMSAEEKQRSRARIVTSAARLFREHGLDGASVADVMNDAGMTHGGFYKHFDSKDALIEAALESAFNQFVELAGGDHPSAAMLQAFPELLAAVQAREGGPPPPYASLYLAREHVERRGFGCPVAALGPEISRASTAIKRAFGAGVRRMIGALASTRKGSAASRRTAAIREFTMLVGAMVIARASDPELASEVLTACGGAPGDDDR